MKRVTRWSPDTCSCILEYEWDDTQDENTRVHTYSKIVKACPEHTGLIGKPLYNQVVSENTRKNIAFAIIQKEHPKVTLDNYLWFFDKSRELQVSLMGIDLTGAARQGLQTAFNAKFGEGKVKVL